MGPLNDINPSDIERIEIVKGPAATRPLRDGGRRGRHPDLHQARFRRRRAVERPDRPGPSTGSRNSVPPTRPSCGSIPGCALRTSSGTPSLSAGEPKPFPTTSPEASTTTKASSPTTPTRSTSGVSTSASSPAVTSTSRSTPRSRASMWRTRPAAPARTASPTTATRRSPAIGRHATYVGSYEVDVISRLLEYQIDTDVDRIVAGFTTTFTPMPRFTNRLTLGVRPARERHAQHPALRLRERSPGFGFRPRMDGRAAHRRLRRQLRPALHRDLPHQPVVGRPVHRVPRDGSGGEHPRVSPGPGEHTVTSGASYQAREARSRVVNAGIFGQTLLDFSDRYFLTVAMRIDGNSAFGPGLRPPALSARHLLVGHVRRGLLAAGSGGDEGPRRLGARRASSRRLRRSPHLGPDSRGSAKPRSTHGIWVTPASGPSGPSSWRPASTAPSSTSASGSGSTYYDPGDARRSHSGAAYTPAWASPARSCGTSACCPTRAWMLDVNGTLMQSRVLSWDLGLTVYTNKSEAVDLGGNAGFRVSGNGWLEEGHPVPAVRYDRLMNPDEIAEPDVDRNHIWGPNQPTLDRHSEHVRQLRQRHHRVGRAASTWAGTTSTTARAPARRIAGR